MAFKRVLLWWHHWVNNIISGTSPPLYFTLTLIAMQDTTKTAKTKQLLLCVTSSNNKDQSNTIIATRIEDHDDVESSDQVHDPVIHLEVDEEQQAITQGGKRQAERTGFLAPYLSGRRHTDAPHAWT